ncbi:hypothetical protein A2643_01655 [Candidatus Nomurabacteria bacterium RIFCSPHIGHO2_01_FULL_39_220]|uniref:Uncharacterized protein n=1 Tax=Candidatus Nomurabacteria bacterium RIFCSPLOWO2_02_FULL_40_67 TaxID=1801787 RepID=A0A1F6Y7D2_9BACT|nr:MAG: hypothetical protein UU01_C0006G0002 [Parcubacteria group bacterium GW2011_GWA2_40_37]OGI62174.1 MAG: hypothetical protein A2W12_01070 [Candidatus Nomurabacteria bacterium RBG_16_40_11]OGI70535.1 MAG: hypothetical protein A2643_01655 [Candidatus Nomurabacteria bacterium RIFCSPHIGHO2_01_FULL_39_220]OGI71981.1 MAG: hypothetical protein A2W56_03045 [Candidatus Nomurabacteria bacterium RIFCSPHIGHO2_02_41_18]OGI79004.1 MAG: hypothetical protein A3C65_01205 [Candidatus Nomurabacteria bacteriu
MHNIFPNKIVSALIIFLAILNIILWSAYSSRGRELRKVQDTVANIEHSRNILAFQKLFVDKVLKSDGVVDYDTRRELEQSVGRTNDDAVISAWNAFLSAKTEDEGQVRVKELLSVLAERAYQGE